MSLASSHSQSLKRWKQCRTSERSFPRSQRYRPTFANDLVLQRAGIIHCVAHLYIKWSCVVPHTDTQYIVIVIYTQDLSSEKVNIYNTSHMRAVIFSSILNPNFLGFPFSQGYQSRHCSLSFTFVWATNVLFSSLINAHIFPDRVGPVICLCHCMECRHPSATFTLFPDRSILSPSHHIIH